MLKGQDIVVLVRLLAPSLEPGTVREIGAPLGFGPSVVQRALDRLERVRLVDDGKRRPNRIRSREVLVHAVPYIFPPEQAGASRGTPTGWAAPPLSERLAPVEDLPPIWPDPEGTVRGISIGPLHESVPAIARADAWSYSVYALVDAIRLGEPRIRGMAVDHLDSLLAA